MKILKLSNRIIKEVIEVINKGGVIVFPTDTVYGFICDATNKKAVEKIFKIKKRSKKKTLPIFINSIKEAKELAEINKKQEEILGRYWPGKYTFILTLRHPFDFAQGRCSGRDRCLELKIKYPKSKIQNPKQKLSKFVISKDNTIGIRIPNYKELNSLLKKVKIPLAQTSANISDFPATTRIEEVINYFKNKKEKPSLIIDAGNLKKGKPSKILDIVGEKLIKLR